MESERPRGAAALLCLDEEEKIAIHESRLVF